MTSKSDRWGRVNEGEAKDKQRAAKRTEEGTTMFNDREEYGVSAVESQTEQPRPVSATLEAKRPVRPAPARMGEAGISAGEDANYKNDIESGEVSREDTPHKLAKALGWFSIALGLGEIVAGGALCEWMGTEEMTPVIRAYGVREIATGAVILGTNDNTWVRRGVRARVAGDALDLATLGLGLRPTNKKRSRVGIAIGAVAGVMALDILCSQLLADR